MTLDPRRVALQGIGYAALAIAVQGFIAAPTKAPVLGGGGGPKRHIERPHTADLHAQLIQRQNETVLAFVMAAVTEGCL